MGGTLGECDGFSQPGHSSSCQPPQSESVFRGAGVSHYMLDGLGVVSAFYYVCKEDARELVLGMGKRE